VTQILVLLEGVTALERDAVLLRDVTWTIRAGEHWVVLGPNGAGKTTLLELLAGYRLPSRGRAALLGSQLGRVDIRELRSRIGYCSGALQARIRPDLRVLDFVVSTVHGQLLPWRKPYTDTDWARARDRLEQVGARALADRVIRTLSEGEQQRVQIARALMGDPELLLLDEPVSGLDLGAREALVELLGQVCVTGVVGATCLVTHHVEDIPPTSTHALLLRDGRVLGRGSIDEVLTAGALSRCFGVDLRLDRRDGRFWARASRRVPT
jgi:iron complex transport system ATP-binding protein